MQLKVQSTHLCLEMNTFGLPHVDFLLIVILDIKFSLKVCDFAILLFATCHKDIELDLKLLITMRATVDFAVELVELLLHIFHLLF